MLDCYDFDLHDIFQESDLGVKWGKVKCTLLQALKLCTGRMAHRGSGGIALPFLDHGTWRGWGVSVTPRLLFTPRKDTVTNVQEAGWAPGPVWTGAENLAPTGIRPPDHPAHGQSLYRLCYPAHGVKWDLTVLWLRTAADNLTFIPIMLELSQLLYINNSEF